MDTGQKPPRGSLNSPEVDSRFGRRWLKRGETRLPVLYSTIGDQLRNTRLHRTICRWVIGTPNWKKLLTDQYRKRWPLYRGLRASLFAEFALKPFATRSFFETCHMLPFYGRGCTFWRGNSVDSKFRLTSIDYRIRPWKGEARGDMYMNGMLVRKDVAPLGKSAGKWNFEFPQNGHKLHYRPPFPNRL